MPRIGESSASLRGQRSIETWCDLGVSGTVLQRVSRMITVLQDASLAPRFDSHKRANQEGALVVIKVLNPANRRFSRGREKQDHFISPFLFPSFNNFSSNPQPRELVGRHNQYRHIETSTDANPGSTPIENSQFTPGVLCSGP